MLLDRFRIRGKLTALVIIPLIGMFGLTLPVVAERVGVAQRAGDIETTITVASRVGSLLQHLQHERMLAFGLLLGQADRSELVQEIAEVDDMIVDLRADLGAELPRQVSTALDGLKQLAEVRAAALTGQADPAQILGAYGPRHIALIDSLRLSYDVDTQSSAGRQVLALDGILRMGEGLSTGGALTVLLAATPDPQLASLFVANNASLVTESQQVIGLLTPAQLELVNLEQAAVVARTSPEFLVQSALDPVGALADLTAEELFPAMSSMITLGQFVEKKLIADVTAEVRAEREAALSVAYWVTLLVLLVLIGVVALAVTIGRSVANPLTRLTRSADRVARVAESELTRVADDETDTAQPVRLDAVDVRARDEIGDLARAFERVQDTAARLVERQAASRRNVAQMFGHVGRRTQNLVGRQLALIDRLEREEANPERLESLYRLDHISSRLRRNAGSLVVLSGATGDDPHVAPVQLGDVVRLALGEIEDYTRVDVRFPPGIAAAPAVVGDLLLVLAELMENATVFSPPHTRVLVSGELAGDGVRVSVTDHGIGMTEARLADENSRLTRRERLDLAPTEVLGLFVVGRLARRHGWTVSLTATAGGGVTATVLVPLSDLVVGTPEPPGGAVVPFARTSRPGGGREPQPAIRRPAGGSPTPPGRALAVVTGSTRPVIESTSLPGFDPKLLTRATESIEVSGSWDAFATSPTTTTAAGSPPVTAPDQVPAGPSDSAPQVRQLAPPSAPPAPAGPLPGVRQRVPGASLPMSTPRIGPVDATSADPTAARALVEQFESGVRRAEQTRSEAGPAPISATAPVTARAPVRPTKLTRRVPGANLVVPPPRQAPAQNPGNPAEVRDLMNAFETGVARALRDVRPDHSSEEGKSR
ncbi:HAMP domain-containing protein [Micromonospora zingiberis]|uniref:histidine kinase n=1 Tax=Micromonospora zingiberis TaxID=2053011 RepID=A0A4R0GTL9_9ACTN|nr:sensor histidine kinase [Micromonospora zingiberis]TCB99041.1 HAMP domain-containing protein [Micromonospora zingiberis]